MEAASTACERWIFTKPWGNEALHFTIFCTFNRRCRELFIYMYDGVHSRLVDNNKNVTIPSNIILRIGKPHFAHDSQKIVRRILC